MEEVLHTSDQSLTCEALNYRAANCTESVRLHSKGSSLHRLSRLVLGLVFTISCSCLWLSAVALRVHLGVWGLMSSDQSALRRSVHKRRGTIVSSDRHSQTLGSYLIKAQEIKHLPAAFDSVQSPFGPGKTQKRHLEMNRAQDSERGEFQSAKGPQHNMNFHNSKPQMGLRLITYPKQPYVMRKQLT